MERDLSKITEKPSTMEIAADMRRAVMEAAGEPKWGQKQEFLIWLASQRLGISPRRAKAFFYREARSISAEEYALVQARIRELREHDARRRAEIAAMESSLSQARGTDLRRAGDVSQPTRAGTLTEDW